MVSLERYYEKCNCAFTSQLHTGREHIPARPALWEKGSGGEGARVRREPLGCREKKWEWRETPAPGWAPSKYAWEWISSELLKWKYSNISWPGKICKKAYAEYHPSSDLQGVLPESHRRSCHLQSVVPGPAAPASPGDSLERKSSAATTNRNQKFWGGARQPAPPQAILGLGTHAQV